MELELKAEPGCTWEQGTGEIHLWHLVRAHSDTTLCELRLDHADPTRPAEPSAEVFPERLCPVCRRRCAELLPFGAEPGTALR
ncbi:hypothetical protein [Streptacidiphilus melanogenes]|uniref:hypothetical protein n=1 Tax=Streptacidiphilus melanogenes TaxID=411235 RepID=UPI0005A6E4FA|nr:hypothetical protein [Streptacidiphilus melanogenes]